MHKSHSDRITDYSLKMVWVAIATIPIIYYFQVEHVPFNIFILGTGSWGIGNIFKIIMHQVIVKKMEAQKKTLLMTSLTNGFLSGFFELSAALFIIWLMSDKVIFNLDAIISFGLAIGSFEIFIVVMNKGNELFKRTSLEKSSTEMLEFLDTLVGFKKFIYTFVIPVWERVMAALLHITTRGLVFFFFFSIDPLPFIFALLIFIIADGLIGYFFHQSGQLASTRGLNLLSINLLVLTLISMILFYLYVQKYFYLIPG